MKSVVVILALLALMPGSAMAQRAYVGPSVLVDGFGNTAVGIAGAVEVPFHTRYEVDLTENYYAYEHHSGYGSGYMNISRAGAIAWLTKSWGVSGSTEFSNYSVTSLGKRAYYAWGGPVLRFHWDDMASKLEFDYLRQFNNGMDSNGIESAHMQGVRAQFDTRIGCYSKGCIRAVAEFGVGHFLQQGNPVCDGSAGPVTCPRGTGTAPFLSLAMVWEFVRHRDMDSF